MKKFLFIILFIPIAIYAYQAKEKTIVSELMSKVVPLVKTRFLKI